MLNFAVWISLIVVTPEVCSLTVWTDIIRQSPYSISQGMTKNLQTIRRWVLLSEGYCESSERHIIFDARARFLGWMQNDSSDEATQARLNVRRKSLAESGRISQWLAGGDGTLGYPFALSCDQPYVNVSASLDRLLGKNPDDRIWGTWDGIKAGSPDAPISLAETVKLVWTHRQSQFEEPLNAVSLELLLAQLLVESGAVKSATSSVNAIGILQLREQALNDCKIPKSHWRHRMAQVDCAVRLYILNRRNLQPAFTEVFGHLPAEKRERLFGLLLVQTYHSGIGNMQRLLNDKEQGKAAAYFARHHNLFSADDIAAGMVFHNMGRKPWGWESLNYIIDIELIEQALCQSMNCQ